MSCSRDTSVDVTGDIGLQDGVDAVCGDIGEAERIT